MFENLLILAAEINGIATGSGLAILGAAIGLGFVVIGTGIGLAKMAAGMSEAMARQPEAAGSISKNMLLGFLLEGVALFAAVIILLAVLIKI